MSKLSRKNVDDDPLSSLFDGGGLFGGDTNAPRAPKKENVEDTSQLLAKLMKNDTEKIALRLKTEKKEKHLKKKKEEEKTSKIPKKSNDVSSIFGNEAVASLRRGDEEENKDDDDFLKANKTRKESDDMFGEDKEEEDEDEQIRNVSTSGKGGLFGGFQKKEQDKIEISELKISSTLGAASSGDNLFTEDVEDVVASAKEDAASQLNVSDDKLKALDLFIGTEDDDDSSSSRDKSGSIDKAFGGLSLFDTTSQSKEKPKASEVDDLFSMTSNENENLSGGDIDGSFDFSSYIQNNS